MQALFWIGAVVLGLYWLLCTVAYGLRSDLLYLWLIAAVYCALCAPFAGELPFLWLPPLIALVYYLAFVVRCLLFSPESGGKPALILILGVRQDGTQPRALFEERVRQGAELALAFPEAAVLLAGGKVFGEKESEAMAMRDALLRRGVPAARLLCEEESRTTRENFLKSRAALAGREILVVTSRFHAYRAACLARRTVPDARFFFSCPRGGGLFLAHLYLRELCAFSADLLRGRLRIF